MEKRYIYYWQQLTYTQWEGQCKADTHTQTIRSYIVSKAESKFWLWASWWPKRKSNIILCD